MWSKDLEAAVSRTPLSGHKTNNNWTPKIAAENPNDSRTFLAGRKQAKSKENTSASLPLFKSLADESNWQNLICNQNLKISSVYNKEMLSIPNLNGFLVPIYSVLNNLSVEANLEKVSVDWKFFNKNGKGNISGDYLLYLVMINRPHWVELLLLADKHFKIFN